MKPYSFALAANTPMDVQVGGEYFLLDEAPYPVDVEFFGASNVKRDESLDDADAGTWAVPREGFSWLRLTSATAQTVTFYVGRGRVGKFRISGEVSVISGELTRTLGGVAFAFAAGTGPVAGQYSHVQLWNPVGSGKRIVVSSIVGHGNPANNMQVRTHSVALATLVGNPISKLAGGAGSVMEVRTENNAAALGGTLLGFFVNGSNSFQLPLVEPIVLPPGRGVIVAGTTVNALTHASMNYWEEPNT